MTATASVSSPWVPEDDLLLKNSIEGGASLEALAKGAVKFSRKFTFREIRDRWYSLLYDPDVSAQASARMAELELSASNPSSKFKPDNNLKGTEKVLEKRKTGSIRKQYHSWRKRLKNDLFNNSQNLGFYEDRSNHVTANHEAPGGNGILDDCLANNLGFEEKDFEILRQAFPESIGSIATTTTTTVIDNRNPFHMERCHNKSLQIQNDFINDSPLRNELMDSFDPNIEIKTATTTATATATCLTETSPNFKSDKPDSGFGGKHHFSSPVSDGSASFHTLTFSSPSARLPLWKTLEDVSAPDMPVDDNNAESHQVTEVTLPLPDDSDHIQENKTSLENRPNGFINSSGVHEVEYTDLPDSLLNFSNEDDILFMNVDMKDLKDSKDAKDVKDIKEIKDTINDAQEVDLCNVDVIPSIEESKDDVASTSVSQQDSLQLTEGQIICTLNKEDPEIPCNDDIFLLIHPSTPFPPCVGQIATDSVCPLSPSSHEKDEQTVRKGKDPAPCFPRSTLPEFGSVFKRESPEGEYRAPLPANLKNPGQTRSMHTPLDITANGMEEDASKAELRGLGSPIMYSEMPLPLEVGTVKMIDPESIDDSYVSDNNNSDSDGDIPYFSDVEAMILDMDLTHGQESCLTSEVARFQYEGTKKMIIRLEQAARSSFQRAMSSQGALAVFYGRRLKHYIKKSEVTIGRLTDDTEVDIDLRKEGRANKISRRQAIIKMEADGSFSLKNLGASSISLNGKEVAHGQVVVLSSSCLIEIRGMSFVFEINEKYVRRFLLGNRRK